MFLQPQSSTVEHVRVQIREDRGGEQVSLEKKTMMVSPTIVVSSDHNGDLSSASYHTLP